jgi:transcriptional regulator with XRE-family HTH domain
MSDSDKSDPARGRRMREARLRAGLTQQEAAVKVESDRATIARWEAGRYAPRYKLEAIAQVYSTTPAWLMHGVGAETALDPLYPAWQQFLEWLETSREGSAAEKWMVDDIRAVRFAEGVEPTLETYKRLLFAFVSTTRGAPK